MPRRSTKFYRKNEEEVMRALGLQPTKNSGAGWIEKEDGQNDFIIAQLKSTDAHSIKVDQKDIRILEYNAGVSHKLPMFAIQFLNTNEVWLMAKPEDFTEIAKYITSGNCTIPNSNLDDFVDIANKAKDKPKKMIKSNSSDRTQFWEEKEKSYGNGKNSSNSSL